MYYTCKVKNLVTGKVFTKSFWSLYLYNEFIKKIKYSNKLRLIDYDISRL